MSDKINLIRSDTDSDDDDNEQMRQFLEAADHTLLTNAMFQEPKRNVSETPAPHVLLSPANCSIRVPTNTAIQKPPKSERYLDEHNTIGADASDLQITEQMQTHIWRKLSDIIQNRIEFCIPVEEQLPYTDSHQTDQVKLVANADCYLCGDIIDEITKPQKKPIIKRRQLEKEETHSLATVVVSGESILSGHNMHCWAKRRLRKDKFFEYKACDSHGHKLHAKEVINEFTAQRRINNWNEYKISQRFKKNNNKKKILNH